MQHKYFNLICVALFIRLNLIHFHLSICFIRSNILSADITNQLIVCDKTHFQASLLQNKVLLSASLKKYVVRKKTRKLWKSSVNLESIPWSYYIISNTCFLEVRSFLRQNKKKNISSYKYLGKFKAI